MGNIVWRVVSVKATFRAMPRRGSASVQLATTAKSVTDLVLREVGGSAARTTVAVRTTQLVTGSLGNVYVWMAGMGHTVMKLVPRTDTGLSV